MITLTFPKKESNVILVERPKTRLRFFAANRSTNRKNAKAYSRKSQKNLGRE